MARILTAILACSSLGFWGVSCGENEPDLEAMRARAEARRAREAPPINPHGTWLLDSSALEAARALPQPSLEPGSPVAHENKDGSVTWLEPVAAGNVSMTVTIKNDGMFVVDGALGDTPIRLDGAVGLDDRHAEMFVQHRDGKEVGSKMTVVGEIEGDTMRLHLVPWRVWVPMRRQ